MQSLPNNVVSFDSMAELHEYFEQNPSHMYFEGSSSDKRNAWAGGISADEAKAMLVSGDLSQIEAAQKLMEDYEVHIATTASAMVDEVAGFAPCVPAYISGAPESMYAMGEVESNMGPLTVLYDPTCSSNIKPETYRRRGTVVLAAVMALSARRPVQLEVVSQNACGPKYALPNNTYHSAVRVKINSQPLDLATACFALCNVAFARHLTYGIARGRFDWVGTWATYHGKSLNNTREGWVQDAYMELLGESRKASLYISPLSSEDELTLRPREWLRSVMQQYGGVEAS